MRAVVVNALGGPSAYELVEAEEPQPAAGQVAVRVSLSGINFVDVYQRSGVYAMPLPFAPGVEGVGVVQALGEGVQDLTVGQRVGWLAGGQGSFSDAVLVAADKLVPLPDDIDDAHAIAVLMQGVTAHYLACDTHAVQPGEVALVHAAAGGVGQLLVQIIKLRGGTVIATASSAQKLALARALGADHAIPYDDFPEAVRAITGGAGADVVFDGVGAATADGSLASLRVRGMLVFFGNASGAVPPIDPLRLMTAGSVYVTRPTAAHYTRTAEELRGRAADLFAWMRSGDLRVAEPTRYELADIEAAFTALESRSTTGKLVLVH